MKGDIDGNGRVSAADAVLPARFVGEDDTLSDAQMLVLLNAEPDLNADGLVTILDVTASLKKLSQTEWT